MEILFFFAGNRREMKAFTVQQDRLARITVDPSPERERYLATTEPIPGAAISCT